MRNVKTVGTCSLELSRMFEGSRAPTLRTQFGASPHAPRAVYLGMLSHFGASSHAPRPAHPQSVPSLWRLPACSEGRVTAHCAPTPELFRMLRGSRTFKLRADSGAISRDPRVAYPRIAHPNVSVCQTLFARKAHGNPPVYIGRCAYSGKVPREISPLARGASAT